MFKPQERRKLYLFRQLPKTCQTLLCASEKPNFQSPLKNCISTFSLGFQYTLSPVPSSSGRDDAFIILKPCGMVLIITVSLNMLCPQELKMTGNVANSELHSSGLQTVPYLLLKGRKCKLALLMQHDLLGGYLLENWEEEGPFTVRLTMTWLF